MSERKPEPSEALVSAAMTAAMIARKAVIEADHTPIPSTPMIFTVTRDEVLAVLKVAREWEEER